MLLGFYNAVKFDRVAAAIMKALGLAEVTHNPKINQTKAK
jgi:hypothetical protein